jgi:hypothetical protein
MKKKIIAGTLLLFSLCLTVWSQEDQKISINPSDPAFREKFSHIRFDGNFAILAVKDNVNNYYMADFTQFPVKFEKVYFMNLVYKSKMIVNIDGDISQERVWFMANKSISDKDVLDEFAKLRDKTLSASASMSAEEKTQWMTKNDKFK